MIEVIALECTVVPQCYEMAKGLLGVDVAALLWYEPPPDEVKADVPHRTD